MKKLFAILTAVIMIIAFTVCASAVDVEPIQAQQSTTENFEGCFSVENENATEGEISSSESISDAETDANETDETWAEKFVGFITEHYEGSSLLTLAITVIAYLFYEIKKHRSLNGSIGILNNNAVKISEASALSISNMLTEAKGISDTVKAYAEQFSETLSEVRKNAEERKTLEDVIDRIESALEAAKRANIEFSNEFADLLLLSNIPNSKKDELYSRHSKAIEEMASEGIHNDAEKA